MPAHYGVALIADGHKNALNVVIALIQSEDASQSENVSQPANADGDENDPFTHWYGGRLYTAAELAVFQDLANNLPTVSWPVAGVSGAVTQQQAADAASAMVLTVITRETYTTPQAQEALTAALAAQGLSKINWS